jgi:hypothetical protein
MGLPPANQPEENRIPVAERLQGLALVSEPPQGFSYGGIMLGRPTADKE